MKKECFSIEKIKNIFINVLLKLLRKCFPYLLIILVLYAFRQKINKVCINYFNDYSTLVYDIFKEQPKIFNTILVLLLFYYLWELRKQFINKYFSLNRVVLVLVVCYVTSSAKAFGWNYLESFKINLNWIVFYAALISGILEFCKLRLINNFFYFFRKKDSKSNYVFSLFTPDYEMEHLQIYNYIEPLMEIVKHIDLSINSYAIGITNPWGSGKTTFMNSLIKEIEKTKKNVVIICFNPWKSNNKELIVADFFALFKESLRPYHTSFREIITLYVDKLQSVDINKNINTVFNFLKGKEGDISLSLLQEHIEEALDKINRTIVVFIDDLDRLEMDEMFEVLKLIRNTASFKHVLFIAAYDKTYVVDTLTGKGITSPEIYLRKIFPLEVALPKLDDEVLLSLLYKNLKMITPISNYVMLYLGKEIYSFDLNTKRYNILYYLRTLRDIKNFTSSFSLSVMAYLYPKQSIINISFSDFFWLEVIHFSDYELYLKLKEDPDSLLLLDDSKGSNMYKLRESDISLTQSQKRILNLVFNREKEHDSTSIIYKVNFNKYFLYGLGIYDIDIKDFHDHLFEDDLEKMKWLTSLFSYDNRYVQSFCFYLTSDVMIGYSLEQCKSFVHMVCLWLGYPFSISNHLKTIFMKNRFPSEFRDSIRVEFSIFMNQCISRNTTDQCFHLGKILNELYIVRIYSFEGEGNGNTNLITNNEITELMNVNFERYLNLTSPNIISLTRHSTGLKSMFSLGVVCDFIDYTAIDESNQPVTCYKNILLHTLISYTKKTHKKNNYPYFIRHFSPDLSVIDSNNIDRKNRREANKNAIISLFGSVEQYKEFFENCFDVPKMTKERYYKKLG